MSKQENKPNLSSLLCPLNAQRVVCDDTCRLSDASPATLDPQKMMELLAWDISERSQYAPLREFRLKN